MGRSQGDLRHTYTFYNVIKPQRSSMMQYSTHFSSEVAVVQVFTVNVDVSIPHITYNSHNLIFAQHPWDLYAQVT